jgi:hypothetical protein
MAATSRRTRIGIVVWTACALLAAGAALRVYAGFVPRGVSFQPWTLARVNGPVLTSPDGRRTVEVYFNDAGAMHSGNHWTWIVENSPLTGRRVVAEGYLGPDVAVSHAPVPLEWGPKNEIRIRFLPARYNAS